MNKATFFFSAIAVLAPVGIAYADVNATGELGTTGAGAHVGVPLSGNLEARVGAGLLAYSFNGSTPSMNYRFNVKADTWDALLDWYPVSGSGFRLTGGLAYNGKSIEVRAKSDAAGNYTMQGNTYDAATVGNVDGQVRFRKLAPYAGLGWRSESGKVKGWSWSTDVGVLLQGSPNTTLANSSCVAAALVCQQFAADLATENVALTAEASRYKAYPVLRIGVNYRF